MNMDINSSSAPLYQQLAEKLKQEINKLKCGERIEGENELALKYDISRGTVRQAISLLVNEGLLYKIQGKGTYKKTSKMTLNHTLANERFSFTEDMRRLGKETAAVNITLQLVNSPLEVAETLQLPSRAKVYKLSRTRCVNGDPTLYCDAFILPELVPGISADSLDNSLFEMLEKKFDLKIFNFTQIFSAMLATQYLSTNMNVPIGAPILVAEFIGMNENNKPFFIDYQYSLGGKLSVSKHYNII